MCVLFFIVAVDCFAPFPILYMLLRCPPLIYFIPFSIIIILVNPVFLDLVPVLICLVLSDRHPFCADAFLFLILP